MGSIKGGGKQAVTDYMMSLHLGVSIEVDAITGIYVDKKVAWEGEITENSVICIEKPQLFGGVKSQGGVRGFAYAMFGGRTQVLDAPLLKRLGRTAADCPGYRGKTTIFFTGTADKPTSTWGAIVGAFAGGLGAFTGLRQGSGRGAGFWWTSNNPQVASTLGVRVRRCPRGLTATNLARIAPIPDTGYTAAIGANLTETVAHVAAAINGTSQYFTATVSGSDVHITAKRTDNAWTNDATSGAGYYTVTNFVLTGSVYTATLHFTLNPVTGLSFTLGPETFTFNIGGSDANPASMIYDIYTNPKFGMGYTADLIDVESFLYAASVLFSESLGLSMAWSTQTKIEDFVNEILSQIQGMVYVSRRTGLLKLKLIRADYNIADLPVYTVDNAVMTNYQKRALTETTNEIVVTWTNPANESAETVYAQDPGNIAAQGGIISDSRNYYGVRNATLAMRLADREVTSTSALLRSMDMEVDHSAWNTEPGDVVVVNWPENNINGAVMRVGQVGYGKIADTAIKVTLAEDIFSLPRGVTVKGAGAIIPTIASPVVDMPNVQVITLPAYFTITGELQSAPVSLRYPEVLAAVLASSTDRGIFDAELMAQVGSVYQPVGTKTVVESTLLTVALPAAATSTIFTAIFTNSERVPEAGGFIMLGTTDAMQEWCEVISNDGTLITLGRGVLDTVPQAWPIGTRIWPVSKGDNVVDSMDIWSAATSPNYKMLPRTGDGSLALADASAHTSILTARPHLPLRPANVKVNGTAFGSRNVAADTNLVISWACRNRIMEDGLVVLWTDGSMTPEYTQETVVTITDNASHSVIFEQGALWTETSLSLPRTNFDRYASVTVKVWSRRGTLASLQSHSIVLTGLLNSGGAPAPPTPPLPADPVSPITPPSNGNWTVTGGFLSGASGDKTPAITITGNGGTSGARSLLARYRVNGTTDWTDYTPIALLGAAATSANITGLMQTTAYDVQLAYQTSVEDITGTALIPSNWMTPTGSPVTTGAAAYPPILGEIYIPAIYVPGPMTSYENPIHMLYHKVGKPSVVAANLAGWQAGASVVAAANTTFTVARALAASPNTFVTIGTIVIAAGTITPTFTTVGGTPYSFAIGDVLRVMGPSSNDSTLADIHITAMMNRTG